MAHTVRTKVYKFDELSEKAKKVAVIQMSDINIDHEWWEFTYEDAANIGLLITSFDIDRGGITGNFDINGANTAKRIIADHGEETDTFKTASRYILNLNQNPEADEDTEHEFLTDILADYLKILSDEFEYLSGDTAIIETIEASEYEFTHDGKRFI